MTNEIIKNDASEIALLNEVLTQEVVSFTDAIAALDAEDVLQCSLFFTTQCDERAAYEADKNSDNESIQKHVKNARKQFTKLSVARFMIAANVRTSFINENERVNARRNIYAIAKLTDLALSVTTSSNHNAVNLHILKSLFKCAAADIEFSHKLALAATSDKVTIDAPMRKHLSRHTVSASTASTQASSTMNALLAAHVVSEYRNDNDAQCYKLNDNALVTHLRASLS